MASQRVVLSLLKSVTQISGGFEPSMKATPLL